RVPQCGSCSLMLSVSLFERLLRPSQSCLNRLELAHSGLAVGECLRRRRCGRGLQLLDLLLERLPPGLHTLELNRSGDFGTLGLLERLTQPADLGLADCKL